MDETLDSLLSSFDVYDISCMQVLTFNAVLTFSML